MELHLTAPECYVAWMNENPGFNPRSQKPSDYLCECVLADVRLAHGRRRTE